MVLLLFVLLGSCIAQSAYWSASFTQNALYSTGYGATGVNTGSIRFNWNTRNFAIIHTGNQWAEYYQYNVNYGETNSSGSRLSTYGATCSPACGVSTLSTAMPPLGLPSGVPNPAAPNNRWVKGSQVGTTGCYIYTPTKNTIVSNYTMTDSGVVCSITLKDDRVFTLANFATTLPTIVVPANCSCKGKADIWILVDHSTSISDNEMNNFKTVFVQPFLNKLAISPSEINVGMSWFHLGTGINFALTGNLANINAGMNAWFTNCSNYPANAGPIGCQVGATATATGLKGWTPPSTSSTCHAYDTPASQIPSGTASNRVVGATEWFVAQANRNVPRIFITLTDGAMNRLTAPYKKCNTNSADACGCSNSCLGPACTAELTSAVNDLVTKTTVDNPGQPLTMISVGIGSTCTDYNQCLSVSHLTLLAGNQSANVLNIASFNADALAAAVNNLVELSYPENNQANAQCLKSCCGICACGVCLPPTSCTNNNLCTKTTLNGICCNADTNTPLPSQCSAAPAGNLCNMTSCNPNGNGGLGACAWSTVDCSAASVGCEKRNCNPSTGTCTVPDRSECPPIPCTYGPWAEWGACPVSCGGSTQTRTRSVNQTAADGGAACDPAGASETQVCNTDCCPIDCSWNEWSPLGICTTTCGGGTQTITRTQNAASCGGAACSGESIATQSCNTECCPVDCSWSEWSPPGPCTTTCGGGTQTITRTQNTAACGGAACGGEANATQSCNTQCCPVDCAWSSWGEYTNCTAPCGGGEQTRTRNQIIDGCPGAACAGDATQTTACNTVCCPVDCSWNSWGTFSQCSCANSTQTRTRTSNAAACGGATCGGLSSDTQPCTPTGCPIVYRPCTGSDVLNMTSGSFTIASSGFGASLATFTVSLWFNIPTAVFNGSPLGNLGAYVPFSTSSSCSGDLAILACFQVSSVLRQFGHTACNVGGFDGAVAPSFLDTWHHMVLVHNNASSYTYVDGVLIDSRPVAFNVDANYLTFGKRGVNGFNQFKGLLSDIAFWNTALDYCSIQDVYAGQMKTSGLLGWWRGKINAAGQLQDFWGAHNATVSGGATLSNVPLTCTLATPGVNPLC